MVTVKDIVVKIDPRNIDRKPIHAAMAAAYLRAVQGTFGVGGRDRASGWPDLSKPYLAKQRRIKREVPWWYGGEPATLFRTGRLFHSIQASSTSDAGVVKTEGVPYARIHQFGLKMRNGKYMPWRPYFLMDRDGHPTARAIAIVTAAAVKAAKFK